MAKWLVKIGYNVFTLIYPQLIRLASLWNKKADLWIKGRKEDTDTHKASSIFNGIHTIWVHAASSGEYLQVLPVMKAYRKQFPETKYLLTFYSPSGYTQWKHKSIADVVTYLPWETNKNLSLLIDRIDPKAVWIVKNEFWFRFLEKLQSRYINTFFISTKVNKKSHINLPYFKDVLKGVTHFFVQDEVSTQLFHSMGIKQVTESGDSRIDHVTALIDEKSSFPKIEKLKDEFEKVFIYGSIYKEDIPAISPLIRANPQDLHILVPHDVSKTKVDQIVRRLDLDVSFYSSSLSFTSPLVIDVIGILNKLYRLADCVYVGGGFNHGIHNTLEPAVYGIPVIFGPNYQKFTEAVEFIQLGIAKSIAGPEEFKVATDNLLKNSIEVKQRSDDFFKKHRGSTSLILNEMIKLMNEES